MTAIYDAHGNTIAENLEPTARNDQAFDVARKWAITNFRDAYIVDGPDRWTVSDRGEISEGWPDHCGAVFGDEGLESVVYGDTMPAVRTRYVTDDGRRVYDLDPNGANLVAVAGPNDATDDDVRRVARDLDSLPDGWRWVEGEEWEALVESHRYGIDADRLR